MVIKRKGSESEATEQVERLNPPTPPTKGTEALEEEEKNTATAEVMKSSSNGTGRAADLLQKYAMVLKTCKDFDGKEDARDWLDGVELKFKAYEVPEIYFAPLASTKMVSVAARWILGRWELRSKPWIEFKKAVLTDFATASLIYTDLQRFLRHRKERSMTMTEYVRQARTLRLGISEHVSDEELIAAFLNGLPDQDRAVLAAMNYKTLAECFNHAVMYAARIGEQGQGDVCAVTRAGKAWRQEGPVDKATCQAKGLCYACGQSGHRAVGCLKRRAPEEGRWLTNKRRNTTSGSVMCAETGEVCESKDA
eukprot:Blabericola_migrator_1__8451@NODE_4406_length_1177_cov_9_709910_g2725_i0_p1_GENE_NODE_4406_length_1177_cov_9_709910_g2725_i0NODE_4406_length_1177_cov_9_709910_g2725_i0_p1_ORF_typecomplete_len309_score46_26Retrotrans_gag/PF03732_17/7_8e09Retrotran_gag_2/PF14223_6/0_0094zfCCHC/PF00098_23/0_052DUF3225/PF11533_8/2_1e03DUF3225/PF11533_8/0_19CCT_2/PF09425_10/0_21zfCCHC_2/PF13696_6/0_31zfCCHC_3/PF13917_6/0_78_NODE_4406_length_1177_cov_9_709910_g2725_i01851111